MILYHLRVTEVGEDADLCLREVDHPYRRIVIVGGDVDIIITRVVDVTGITGEGRRSALSPGQIA